MSAAQWGSSSTLPLPTLRHAERDNGMNLANFTDLATGDEVISTDQEHGGCIRPALLANGAASSPENRRWRRTRWRAGCDRQALRVRDDAAHQGRDV
jgi:hypothetical protein